VIERIELKESRCFFIFEKIGEVERCLAHDDKPVEIMSGWTKADSKKKEAGPMFLFKKKIFLKNDDLEMKDPVAKNLVYLQGVHDVIESVYTCEIPEAIQLAAYQVQVTYSKHNPDIHTAGFLTKNASTNIKSFVPKALWSQKKAGDWESLILKEHAKLGDMSQEEAKTAYLNIIKQWRLYGTTFFPPCKSITKSLPSKVIIGVNSEGISLLKPKSKDIISGHLFTEICAWASSSGTFAFEFGNQHESQKYTFDTRQGSIIASTIQTYIDILVQMLKNGEDDDGATG